MYNPYTLMYDAVMDIYRYTDAEADGYTDKTEKLAASGVKCRYSLSGQSITGSPEPSLRADNQLFCDRDTDIKEGDRVEVTLRDGSKISLQVGEVHPYSFQYQCRVERKTTA